MVKSGASNLKVSLFVFFSIIGLTAFAVGASLAFNLGSLFNVTPSQAETGRQVLLIELVAATTTIRVLSYVGYAMNAYRAYPGLRIRLSKRATRAAERSHRIQRLYTVDRSCEQAELFNGRDGDRRVHEHRCHCNLGSSSDWLTRLR